MVITNRAGGVHSKTYRFVVAGLLCSVGTINYLDRAALGVAAPFVRADLHLSPSALSLLSSTFFGYTLFAFVGGHLADRYGPKKVYVWGSFIMVDLVRADRRRRRIRAVCWMYARSSGLLKDR